MNAVDKGIGAHIPRREDFRLLTGRGQYAADMNAPGQLFAYALRCFHGHARLKKIDVAEAKKAPGVVLVLTGADYAADGLKGIPHGAMTVKPEDHTTPCFTQADGKPAFSAPNIPIVKDKVHHIGEIVAWVVADTLQHARDASELIETEYEVLPAVINGMKALESGAPSVWDEQPGNVAFDGKHGDHTNAEAAFKSAKYVVEEEFPFNRVANAQMEPRACLAEYSNDRFILHAGSQGVHRLKGNAAVVFSCDPQKIRVFTKDTGGGFGPRSHLYPEYVLAMWASRKLGKPVKWNGDRSEGFLSDYQARDVTIKAALALDENGKFLALRETLYSNVGGNCVSYVPAANGSRIATTVYKTPYLQMRAIGILTNTLPSVNYRGAGRPQAMLVMERLVDLAAEKTGIDRIELRRRNLIAPSDFPFKMAGGLTYDCGEFEANMNRCMELIDWKGHAPRREAAKQRGKLCGIGLANYIETPVGAPIERSAITIRTDADKVDVIIGTQSGGQGHETSFAQVIESWLGVPMNDVNIITGDSDIVLEGGGTHSDRSIRLGGFVMVKASEQIIEKGTKIAAHLMEAAAGDIEFRKGDGPARFQVKGTDRAVSLFEAARAAATDKVPAELRGPLSGDHKFVGRIPAYPNGCAAAEVEIDPDTGVVEIARYVCIDDVGRVVNPLIVDGQTHGGIVQGVGQVLTEHVVHDEDGQILTGSFMDYGMPRADMFPEFKVENNEVITKGNPLGVKGGGEAGTTGALAVMMNAILDALKPLGIKRFDMPATPDRVWHAIHNAKSSG